MCIWNCAVEDRHCEFCSYRGGCERYPLLESRYEGAKMQAEEYIGLMSKAVGEDIMVSSRKQNLVWARNMVLYMLRVDGYSLMSIENATGRNHSTVIYATRQVKEMLKKPNMYKDEIEIWNKFLSLQKK